MAERKSLDKDKIIFAVITALMCALALFTLFVYVCSFLPVKRFELAGVTQYDKAEIIEKSGVSAGDRLYSIDTDEVEKRLLESCFYLDEVYVERKFPNRLVIRAVEKIPEWYVEVSGNYYSLDSELMVIEETVTSDKFAAQGIPQLVLPNVRSLILGSLPEFGEDETELKKVLELIYQMQRTNLKPRITLLDAQSRFGISVVVDGKYNVYLGDTSDVKEKLAAVQEILKSDRLKGTVGAEIDASVPETIGVKPIYSAE